MSGFIGTITDITDRVKIEAELMERTRLAELSAAVGVILTEEATLPGMLQRCAQTMVLHLDAHFARIWLYHPRDEVLVLRASAGQYTHLDGPHARIPLGSMKIGLIASERRPRLTNRVVGDPLVSDQEWARREGITSFAGNPLVVGSTLVGVLGLFSRHPLSPATSDWLATIAGEIALGIQRKYYEEQLQTAAFNDELTGFFNRRGFFTLAGKQVEIALRGGHAASGSCTSTSTGSRSSTTAGGTRRGTRRCGTWRHPPEDLSEIGHPRTHRRRRVCRFLSEVRDVGAQRTILSNLRQKLSEHNAKAERPFTLELSAGVAFSGPGVVLQPRGASAAGGPGHVPGEKTQPGAWADAGPAGPARPDPPADPEGSPGRRGRRSVPRGNGGGRRTSVSAGSVSGRRCLFSSGATALSSSPWEPPTACTSAPK